MACYLFINERSHWQTVEALCEGFPQPHVVPPFALIIEAIYPIDGRTLVVASQQEEVFRVLNLRRQHSFVHKYRS